MNTRSIINGKYFLVTGKQLDIVLSIPACNASPMQARCVESSNYCLAMISTELPLTGSIWPGYRETDWARSFIHGIYM